MKYLIHLLALLFFTGCSTLFFYPDSHEYARPSDFGLAYDDYKLSSKDGTKLDAWHIKAKGKSKGLLLLAHGNAQNMSSHFRAWVWLLEQGYDLFIFDYRAYGNSEGEISIEGSVEDVTAALDFVEQKFKGDYFVCGQSLGGTLALAALRQRDKSRIKAVIIDSTFSSFADIASEKLSYSFITWPFKWIPYLTLPGGFDAKESIKSIDKPLLFVHGSKDLTIPANHSWQLFDLSPLPKEFWLVVQAKHINAFNHLQVREDFLTFLEQVSRGGFYHKAYSQMKIYH